MNKDLIKVCIDAYRGNVQNYSKEQANEVIRNAFIDMIGTDKIDYKTFRRFKTEIFEIIETVLDQRITDGWANNPFFDRFVERKDLEFGDKNEFYVEDRSVLIVSKFSGGHWDLRRQKLNVGEAFSVATDWYGVAIYADFERFLAGRIDWATFVQKVYTAFDDKVKSMIYTSFMGAQTYLPAEFKETGSYSAANLRAICEHVSAASGGAIPLIAGTRTALANITGGVESGWVSDTMRDQRNSAGYLQVWEGYTLMPIPQVHTAGTFNFAIADNKLLILPGDIRPVKLVNEGQALIREVSDGTTNVDMSMEYGFVKKFGIGVVFNSLFGVYEIA